MIQQKYALKCIFICSKGAYFLVFFISFLQCPSVSLLSTGTLGHVENEKRKRNFNYLLQTKNVKSRISVGQ